VGDWGKAVRDALKTAAAVVVGAALTIIGGPIAAFGAKIAFSVATSFALQTVSAIAGGAGAVSPVSTRENLLGSPNASRRGYAITVNQLAASLPAANIYGRFRVGGAVFYQETTNNETVLHRLIAFAAHECDAIEEIYLDDQLLTLDEAGEVTAPAVYAGKVTIEQFLGTDDQAAAPGLVADSENWTEDHRAAGICYIHVRLTFDQDAFDSVPTFSAVIRGKKVYDPRSDETAWSDNAALCLRDYLTRSDGLAATADEIDDTFVAAAANICDEAVALAAGGTESRYTTNGAYLSSALPNMVVRNLTSAMGGSIWYAQGKWRMRAAAWSAPVKSFDEDDLRSALSVTTRHSRRDNFNAVSGQFQGLETNWQTVDYPAVTSAAFEAVDGGERVFADIDLPFTPTASAAQRIAKIALYRNREQMTLSGRFGLSALSVQIGDVVEITNTRLGLAAATYEVVSWQLALADDLTLAVDLVLREISAEVFAWDAEETAFETGQTVLADYQTVPAPGISLSTELRVVNQQVAGVLLIDVSTSLASTPLFEVEHRQTGAGAWVSAGISRSTRFEVLNVADADYDVRARVISAIGVKSPWTTISPYAVVALGALPEDVTGFAAAPLNGQLHLTWNAVSDLDLSHYRIRYSPQIGGATYNNAVTLIEKVARPSTSVTVPAATGTYFVKAIDKLGNASAVAAEAVVQTSLGDVTGLNLVEELVEDVAFTGAKSNVVVLDDRLTLNGRTLFDDAAGNFDDAEGLFDAASGFEPSGVYEFSEVVDLGDRYTARIEGSATVARLTYVDLFDSTEGLFDDRPGLFDGVDTDFDDVAVALEYATTNDNPTASPSWSAWFPLVATDVTARAVKFRALLSTEGDTAAPAISALTARVDMPERTESEVGVAVTGSQAITFATPFKETPAIGVGFYGLGQTDTYTITAKSETGFTINIFEGGSPKATEVLFDYVAVGYGRKVST
jgi:hypothetical protein